MNGKTNTRRPKFVSDEEYDQNFQQAFGKGKIIINGIEYEEVFGQVCNDCVAYRDMDLCDALPVCRRDKESFCFKIKRKENRR